jgi:hypothetical protein
MVDTPDSLEKLYNDFIADLFSKHGVERGRQVYKSYDLREKLPLMDTFQFVDTLKNFCTLLSDVDYLNIVIFYTTLNTRVLPTVIYYGQGRTPQKTVNSLDFIDDLQQYYDYICSWKVSKVLQLKGCNILLDSFQGELTNAWDELTHFHDVEIFFKGDQCNPLIASTDFITRFIDESLALNRLKLLNTDIERIMDDCGIEQVKPYYIGHSDVNNIVPAEKKSIPRQNYLKRPSAFLLPENVLEKEKIWFEKSTAYDKVLNFASKIGGGSKGLRRKKIISTSYNPVIM